MFAIELLVIVRNSDSALSSREDTLSAVIQLTNHPEFTFYNPNRVRALLGGYANNHYIFHKEKQFSYAFYIDCLIKLDNLNPQVAVQLSRCFTRLEKHTAERQLLIKHELDRLLKNNTVSKNMSELIHKILFHA